MTCQCGNPVWCRGMCKNHYNQWWRSQNRGQVCSRNRCRGPVVDHGLCAVHLRIWLDNQRRWTLDDKVLDWLQLDGGWLTKEGLADALGHHVDSVTRTLRILRSRGDVQSRVIELAGAAGGNESRMEWKAV